MTLNFTKFLFPNQNKPTQTLPRVLCKSFHCGMFVNSGVKHFQVYVVKEFENIDGAILSEHCGHCKCLLSCDFIKQYSYDFEEKKEIIKGKRELICGFFKNNKIKPSKYLGLKNEE